MMAQRTCKFKMKEQMPHEPSLSKKIRVVAIDEIVAN